MDNDKDFVWTDELVLLALDYAHHNGYHKFPQRCVEVFDEVKNQAMRSGYQYPKWIIDHVKSKQPKKEKLFTTEDNVDIHEGDTYWTVFMDTFQILKNEKAKGIYFYSKSEYKSFSTEDASKEYIKKHKPKYSEEDLEKAFNAGKAVLEEPIGRVEFNDGDFGSAYKNKFANFSEYIQSLNKQTEK